MFLEKNSFKLLGVNLTDDTQAINEVAEKKSFTDEDNETAYDNARIELASPNRRLAAEISYVDFTGICEHDDELQVVLAMDDEERALHFNPRENGIIEFEKVVCLMNSVNIDLCRELKYSMLKIDRLYRQAFFSGNMRKDIEQLNRFRSSIKISKIDIKLYQNTLREMLNTYLVKIIDIILSKLDFDNIVQLVNEIVVETVGKSIGKNRQKYGYVVEKIVESYMIYCQELVEVLYDKLCRMIEKAYSYDSWRQLTPLVNKIKELNRLVQSIKIYFLYLGQSEKQFEINDIAAKVRLLALYYHTEKELTDLSVNLIEFEIKAFPELPLIYEKLIRDRNTLTKIAKKNYVKLATGRLCRNINKKIIRDDEYIADNMLYIQKNIGKWEREIERISREAKNKDDYRILAGCVLSIAKAITWGDCWDLSYKLVQLGNVWAENSSDTELLSEYDKYIIKWKDS